MSDKAMPACESASHIQVSDCGNTVWVFADDGSTVGRFSKTFGMDVHTTISQQMSGANQCLHCTHVKPTKEDWLEFCRLMRLHFAVSVDTLLIQI